MERSSPPTSVPPIDAALVRLDTAVKHAHHVAAELDRTSVASASLAAHASFIADAIESRIARVLDRHT